jgi:integrase
MQPQSVRVQDGTIDRPRAGGAWRVRWTDHDGVRRSRAGFKFKTKAQRVRADADGQSAREFLDEQLAEVDAIRGGGRAAPEERPATVDDLLDVFLAKHGARIDPATKRKLESQLKHARKSFGDRRPDTLRRAQLEDWREELPAGNRHDCFRAFRQAFAWAVARGLVREDPTVGIKNPKRPRAERADVFPFEDWTEVEAVAVELDKRYQAIPILLAGTGLRPEEAFGLHRADVDAKAKVVHVRRRFTSGMVKEGGKTPGSVRTVPLRQRVIDALEAMPPRIDTPILFPAPRGGYIDIEKFRHREWVPALKAAGIPHRRVYDLRHTFATWSIASGVPTLTLAKLMGTSVGQLEDTYVRWLKGDADRLRDVFDAADASEATG